MKKIIYNGEKGVFYTDKEFQTLREKILAQKELISKLEKEVRA